MTHSVATIYSYITTPNGGISNGRKVTENREGSGRGLIEILPLVFAEGTEEHYKEPQ
jgi:hypothetical protein